MCAVFAGRTCHVDVNLHVGLNKGGGPDKAAQNTDRELVICEGLSLVS